MPDQIRAIVAHNARQKIGGATNLQLQLKSWWSRTYNRPMKDPLLESYTLEELIYEYYDHIERDKASEEAIEEEADRIEEAADAKANDWADEMEADEMAELAAMQKKKQLEKEKAEAEAAAESEDPREDPANIEWMEQVMNEGKEEHGSDFGEDLSINFDES